MKLHALTETMCILGIELGPELCIYLSWVNLFTEISIATRANTAIQFSNKRVNYKLATWWFKDSAEHQQDVYTEHVIILMDKIITNKQFLSFFLFLPKEFTNLSVFCSLSSHSVTCHCGCHFTHWECLKHQHQSMNCIVVVNSYFQS